MTPHGLKPFWSYFGGKYRAAPMYPLPTRKTIVEPFAGAAGYSMRHYEHDVVLIEKYPVIAEIWRFLIGASAREVMSIPCVDHIDDLPSWVPEGARWLVGFTLNAGTDHPCNKLSSGRLRMREMGRKFEGWTEARRERTAFNVERIKHWRIIEGDYSSAPDIEATWFIDPPYSRMLRSYACGAKAIDYGHLGAWASWRYGQIIVCEGEGADWLPFVPFSTFRQSINGPGSRELIWTAEGARC